MSRPSKRVISMGRVKVNTTVPGYHQHTEVTAGYSHSVAKDDIPHTHR